MAGGTLGLSPALSYYLTTISPPEPEPLARLRKTIAEHHEAHWHVSADQAQFMGLLAQIHGARSYLELGTFAGYGTLAMALACPALQIVTCEIAEEFVALGRPFWHEAGVADRISLRMGPALESMTALTDEGAQFDMVFVDADKRGYPDYVTAAKALVPVGGLIMVDNVFWSGAVADPSDNRKSTCAIRTTNTLLSNDPDFSIAVVPIGDGLTIARRQAP